MNPNPQKPICKKCPVCGSQRLSKNDDSMICRRCGYTYEGGKTEGFQTFDVSEKV